MTPTTRPDASPYITPTLPRRPEADSWSSRAVVLLCPWGAPSPPSPLPPPTDACSPPSPLPTSGSTRRLPFNEAMASLALICDTEQWKALQAHISTIQKTHLRDLMADADHCKGV